MVVLNKVNLKDGVIVREINPFTLSLIQTLLDVGKKWSYIPTITSWNDGKHKEGSFHYRNLALDIRTNDLPPSRIEEYFMELKAAWGDQVDLINEKDHFHAEPSPKNEWSKK